MAGVDVAGEVTDEVVLGDPGEPLGVDVEIRHRGWRWTLLEQRSDRLALVEPESRDVDEATTFGASVPREVMTWPPSAVGLQALDYIAPALGLETTW